MKSKNKYQIPLAEGVVTVAISDPRAHSGYMKHAVDFLLEKNVFILAAASGTVIEVKVDSDEGGLDEKYKDNKYQNYITIEHDNGEFTQYIHLAKDSATVKKGDAVSAGQEIAKSAGVVGYTSALHLHFMVFVDADNELGFETLEIDWNKAPIVYQGGEKELAEELQKPEYKSLLAAIQESQQ